MIIAVRFGHESFDKAHSSRSVSLSTRADMLRSAALRRRLQLPDGADPVRDPRGAGEDIHVAINDLLG